MSNLKWVSGLVLGCALAINACSSDDDSASGGAGAKGEAGAAGEAAVAGGGSGATGGEAGAATAGAADTAGAAGAAEGGAAGTPATGGTSGGGTSGASTGGTGGLAAASCLDAGEIDVSTVALTYKINGAINPELTLCKGSTYTFVLDATNSIHPFYVKTVDNSTTAANAFTEGVTGNGNTSGNVVFTVPADAPATLYYHCAAHNGMGGKLTIIAAP